MKKILVLSFIFSPRSKFAVKQIYRHVKQYVKEFKINNLGNYHDLHVPSDTLLLADVFENFRNICIGIYELDLAHFLSGNFR